MKETTLFSSQNHLWSPGQTWKLTRRKAHLISLGWNLELQTLTCKDASFLEVCCMEVTKKVVTHLRCSFSKQNKVSKNYVFSSSFV